MPSARAFGCAVVLVVAVTAPRPVSPAPGDLAESVVDLESRPRVAQGVRLIRPESPVGSSILFAGRHGELENVIERAR